jgi:stage II sporulation protein R
LKNKIVERVIAEGKLLGISLFVGLLLAFGIAAYSYVYSSTVQQNIADNVIRFHVLAHSDDAHDQYVKEQVRQGVLAEFESVLSGLSCIEETRATLVEYLPAIRSHTEYIVRNAGFEYTVTADMSRLFFPTRFYGNMAFPPGEYETVQIIIGDGKGSNWWCLMFPPLCYVDLTASEEGRQQLSDTLTEEGFRLIMHQEEECTGLVVRFRIVEWWQNRNQPNNPPPTQQIILTD